MPSLNSSLPTSSSSLRLTSPVLSTLSPLPENSEALESSQALGYIFLSLGAVVIILVVMAMVLLLLRKRRLDRLRHHLMPLYNFDVTEEEQEDWEAELLEDSSESHKLRKGYKSMEFPPS